MEKCENCGRKIGNLEPAHIHAQHVVCSECHARLAEAPSADAGPSLEDLAAVAAEPRPENAEAPDEQDTKECPFCAERIHAKARKCRYCGERLEEADGTYAVGAEPKPPLPSPPRSPAADFQDSVPSRFPSPRYSTARAVHDGAAEVIKKLLIYLFVLGLVVACVLGGRELYKARLALPSNDPKSSFEAMATRIMAGLQEKISLPITGETPASIDQGRSSYDYRCVVPGRYSMDVRKTDSLVTPYTGLLSVEIGISRLGEPGWTRAKMTFRCALQDDKWVLKSAHIIEGERAWESESDGADLLGIKDDPERQIFRRVRAAFVEAGASTGL